MTKVKETPQKVLFLDRDGVINRKAPPHQYITQWLDFYFLPDVFDILKWVQQCNYRLAVITNQQGIGKGIMSLDDLNEIHENMQSRLGQEGIKLDGIFYCPHLQIELCSCRKPAPGLFYQAEKKLPYLVHKQESWFIGDSTTDIEAGQRYGIKTIYLNSENSNYPDNKPAPDVILRNILELRDILQGY